MWRLSADFFWPRRSGEWTGSDKCHKLNYWRKGQISVYECSYWAKPCIFSWIIEWIDNWVMSKMMIHENWIGTNMAYGVLNVKKSLASKTFTKRKKNPRWLSWKIGKSSILATLSIPLLNIKSKMCWACLNTCTCQIFKNDMRNHQY